MLGACGGGGSESESDIEMSTEQGEGSEDEEDDTDDSENDTDENSAPVAIAQAVSTNINTALSITLSGSDADGDTLTYTVNTQPQNGILSGSAPNLTYTPNTDFMGNDSFTFTVNDGEQNSNPADVNINVSMSEGGDHACMMVPDFAADNLMTHVAVQSGSWQDASTWGGNLPNSGAYVQIPNDITVTINGVLSERIKTVRIDGTLAFANNVNTELKVDNLVSNCSGLLQIGTEQNPINADVQARILFINNGSVSDTSQLSRGAILMGTTEVYGAAKTHRAVIFPHASSGDSSLTLTASPSGWQVGDQLIITGTIVNDPKSDEIRTITSINGAQIGLNSPLSLDHIAPKSDLNVYVANATRNVIFASESQTLMERGHIMFMHTLDVNINNASFIDLGRTDKTRALDDVIEFDYEEIPGNFNQAKAYPNEVIAGSGTNIRGRYPFHLHRGGIHLNRQPAKVEGSVVLNSPGWGFVSHSSYADFINNVTYDVQGTAYYTEAGDEVGTMRGNIAIRTVNSTFTLLDNDTIDPDEGRNPWEGSQRTDYGHQGDGFWLAGNMVAMVDNVVSGTSAHGIIYWVDGIIEPDLPQQRSSVKVANITNRQLIPNREEIPIWYAPLAQVSGNEVYNTIIGFRSRYIHTQTYYGEGGSPYHKRPPQAYIDTLNPMIDRLTVWNVRDGVMLNYGERLGIKNSRIIGIGYEHVINLPTTHSVGIGLDMANHVTRGPGRVENVSIENFSLGFMLPTNDQWVIEDMTLDNDLDMWINNPFAAPRTLTMNGINFVRNSDIRVEIQTTVDNEILQPNFFVMPDHVTLNGQGLYSDGQAANFIPGIPGLDPDGENPNPKETAYLDKTNQQLQNQYGLSYGGRITPPNATQVDWLDGGLVGAAPPAATVFPPLYDMTGEGYFPEPVSGTVTPEITANTLTIAKGETVTLIPANLNTTDTNTERRNLTYTVQNAANGYFTYRDTDMNAKITTFTQVEVDGGVVLFVHDGSNIPPSYGVSVSDGETSTQVSMSTINFVN